LDCVKIKARKPIHTHYEFFKILAFNNAKKVKHVKLTWKLLIKETKWKYISKVVMANGHSNHHYIGLACKMGLFMTTTRKHMMHEGYKP
jgi:hypothetical protein